MKNSLFILIFIGLGSLVCAQQLAVDTQANRVIAHGGLRLRAEPNQHSRILQVLPFGAQVTYRSDQSFNLDSIAIIPSKDWPVSVLYGNWVYVAYRNQKGYVLDLFLGAQGSDRKRFGADFNSDFVLLFPGCGCNPENFYDPQKWTWYGYFQQDSTSYTVEQVQISNYRSRVYPCDLFIGASKMENLVFVIGSKKKDWGNGTRVHGEKFQLETYDGAFPDSRALSRLSLEMQHPANKPADLFLKRGKIRQQLNETAFGEPVELKFAGDLDGDQKPDYILHYGDKGGVIVLYLSTRAKPGKLVQGVAIFYASYCC